MYGNGMGEILEKNYEKKKYSGILLAPIIVCCALFSTVCVQFTILSTENFMRISNRTFALNVLCILGLYLLVHAMTNHIAWTYAICHTGLLVLAFIDYYVYLFRGNEFTFADIRSLGTGLSVAEHYRITLHTHGLIVLLLSVAVFLLFLWKGRLRFRRAWRVRTLCGLFGVLSLVFVLFESGNISTETWQQKGSYRNGYVLNFTLSVRDSFVGKPKGYDEAFIEQLEKQYGVMPTDAANRQQKEPTIIVIMNESFADLSVLGELQTNIPLTPFLDGLRENTTRGYALSSVFGAKTPNSEWEYLTGHSMAFLPEGSVVYQQYLKENAPSLVSTLKGQGYSCVAMHPYYSTGWSRNQVYRDLGFDEMYFLESFDKTRLLREYITDEELYDRIIERYENRKLKEKLFVMGISMQNHGGYTKTYENFTEECMKTGKSYTDANQYFSLVHESDKALEKLITYFEQEEEPVEIVFFGDHQPSLNANFYPLLNKKGLSGLTLSEVEQLYMVPFFVWTNYDSGEEEVEITSLNYLSVYTLEKANLPLPPYYQLLSDIQKKIPAINSRGYYSKSKGEYLHLEDAAGEEALWLQTYHMIQYNAMFDEKHRSRVFFYDYQ